MKKKVVIVQPILAHYRNSLFCQLAANNEFDIKIIAGKKVGNVKELISSSGNITDNLDNKKIKIANHTFFFQRGSIKYIKKEKPDIVVLTGVDPHIISNLWISVFCRLFTKIKVIWWGHADINKKVSFGKVFRLFFFNLANGIFTYNLIGKRNIQAIVNKNIYIEAIRNCINDGEYGFNHQRRIDSIGKDDKLITILFSGRITPEKRLDILIDSLSLLKLKDFKFRCFVIGDGIDQYEIEKQANLLELGNDIEFVGAKYQEECYPYFEQADLFVLPGKVGLSIIHGLSYGLPVITSDKIEIHSPEYEIINPGFNGDFFEGYAASGLAEKICLWSDKIRADRINIMKQCISSIIENGYTPDAMSKKMIDIFRIISK